MKRAVTTIVLSFSFFSIGISAMANTTINSSPVTQIILSPKPHILPMQINDMTKINNIFTAGHYAWAVNCKDAIVVFYNGKNWTSGQQIPGMTSLRLYPAYPVSGLAPAAWAMGWNNTQGTVISYFDGIHWSPIQSASSILNNNTRLNPATVDMRASAGFAYLLTTTSTQNGNNNTIYSVTNIKTHQWEKPSTISGQYDPYGSLDSMNDITPNLYLLVHSSDGSHTLYSVNGAGVATPYDIQNLHDPYSTANLLVQNDYLYINYEKGDMVGSPQFIAYKNKSTNNVWSYVLDANIANVWPEIRPENENAGLVCKDIYDSVSQKFVIRLYKY